ncbi:major facilitator superfamily [Diplodia corticola]|uniref:Major facilitator superfamily n=1 Tax=Diplodia corticola TaxID=236234 RepID=A0A1J9RFI8_9PEZI|nr:major facilitator superfamily [Diplodia corticola]OJD31299.1 major facilitator superfamily [Diplodia corticola]
MLDIIGAGENVTSFSWEAQPQTRGTFGILSTCFVTLALCTWKIVHLNLPGICPDDDLAWSDWWSVDRTVRHKLVHICGGHQLVRQIGWLVIGLFAPELIAFAAFKQYWDAKHLQKYMEENYLEQNKGPSWWPAILRPRASPVDAESNDEDKPVWTMTHSFYAVMGGFTYTLREGSRVYLPDDRNREQLTLRHEAIRFVAKYEPSIIPKLTVNAIRDKSKASAFVKVITLFQAIWFSLQCIVRMQQGLSISLLELTTFAHCICGLLVGAVWLQKPLGVQEPTPLEMPKSIRQQHWLMAMLYTLSSFDHRESDDDRYRKTARSHHKPIERTNVYNTDAYNNDNNDHATASQLDLSSPAAAEKSTSPRPASSASQPPPSSSSKRHSRLLPKLNPARAAASAILHAQKVSSPPNNNHAVDTDPNTDPAATAALRRYTMRTRLAQKGWTHYILAPAAANTDVLSDPLSRNGPALQRRVRRDLRDALADRVPNFPRRSHLRRGVTLRTHLAVTLTGCAYGALHLLAWDAPFATRAEAVLWRLAALSLAASGLLVPVARVEGWMSDAVRPFLLDRDGEGDEEEARRLAELGVVGFVRSYERPHADPVAPRPGVLGVVEEGLAEAGVGSLGGRSGEEEKGEVVGHDARSVVSSYDGWRHFRDLVFKAGLGWAVEVLRVCRLVVLVVVGAVYIGLRVFIFVECLINVGNLPSSAYKVVQWSQYVPHIS